MKINLAVLLTTLILLNGCASKNDHKFVDQVSQDLVKTFDLSNEKFNKFKVSQIDEKKNETKTETVQDKSISKNKVKIVKKVIKKKKKVAIVKKDLPSKIKKKNEPEKIKGFEFPEDYPEPYKEWDKTSENIWNKFKPNVYPGEELILEISFLGITVGAVRLKTHEIVGMDNRETVHLSAALKSASYYSMIYKLDDTLTTYVETEKFLPMKYTLTQRESGQSVDDLQLYDHENRKTFFWYKRLKKGVETKQEKKGYMPSYMQNIFSSLYFIRGLPLKVGSTYKFPIVTRTKIWMMTMSVEKKEEIKVMGKWVKSIKINAFTRVPGEKKKNGTISFWYSDDNVKRLLDFKANVKIGHVEGKLIEYHAGKHFKKE
jgi:hypothetical protein